MRVLLFTFLYFVITIAHARDFDGFFTLGYGQGGDKLNEFTGGQDYKIKAGSGLLVSAGGIVAVSPTAPHRFEAQFGVGYLIENDADEKENSVSWHRIPLEALYYYRNTQEQFRFGWGVTYHLSGTVSAKGTKATAATKVDDAFGWVLAAEKLWKPKEDGGTWAIGIRYTMIKYKSQEFAGSADGNAWMITASGYTF